MNGCNSLLGRAAIALLACAMALGDTPATRSEPALEKTCPKCHARFPNSDRFCPVDGVPLADASMSVGERTCPRCQRTYREPARFCAIDGAPLKAIGKLGSDSKAVGERQTATSAAVAGSVQVAAT